QGLDGVTLEPAGNGRVALASPGLPVMSLLLAYPPQLLLEHVHPALRIVVQEAVQGNFDIDGGYPVLPYRHARRATPALRHALPPRTGCQGQALGVMPRGAAHRTVVLPGSRRADAHCESQANRDC